jgi:acetyl esterase/lipase
MAYRVFRRRRKNGPRCESWKFKHEFFVEVAKFFLQSMSQKNQDEILKLRPTLTIKVPYPKRKITAVVEVLPSPQELGIEKDLQKLVSQFVHKIEEKENDPEPPEALEDLDNNITTDELVDKLISEGVSSPGAKPLNAEWLIPKNGLDESKVIYYLHGGAYILCSPGTHRSLTWKLAEFTKSALFAIDYRLAPEYSFPCPLEDALHGYLYLINNKGYKPENITIAGDSAGGGLTLAFGLYLRDNGYPQPGCLYLISPWVDLNCSGESWTRNFDYDYLLNPSGLGHLNPAVMYGRSFVKSPYVSPLFCDDFSNLPKVIIQIGSIEMLHDDVTKIWDKMSPFFKIEAEIEGKDVSDVASSNNSNKPLKDKEPAVKILGNDKLRLEIYKDMPHVFQMFSFFKPADEALKAAATFIKTE